MQVMSVIIMSDNVMPVQIMSVNNEVRQKYWSISVRLFGISDLRSVNNINYCLKITAYDGIGANK